MEGVPSDIVELIIAVDLNPSDPEEPINVKGVDVRGEGEVPGGFRQPDEDWRKLTMQLLMGDPKAGVTSDSISYDEAVSAVARALGDEEEASDPFSKAKGLGGDQEKPGMLFRKGNGMKSALNRALGRDDEEDEED